MTLRFPVWTFCLATILLPTMVIAEQSAGDGKTAEKVTFDGDVLPILRQHCLNCHHAGDARGGLAMDTYTALREGGGSGEIVYDDGDADASRLWQLVNHDDTPVMPPSKVKLPDADLQVIRRWIENGILENDGSVAKAKPKNALAEVAVSTGRPEGGGAMPGEDFPQKVPVVTDRPGAVTAIAASPWAPLVAIGGQKQIVLYRTTDRQLLGVLPFEEGIPQSIRFSVDGSHLIVGGGTHSVRGCVAVYDVVSGQRLATVGDDLDTVFDADANPGLNRIALGGPQKRVRIFDATDGEMLFDLDKHTDWIFAVAFSPDGVLIASGDRSGGLHLWEAETGRLYMDLVGHKGAIRAIDWRDDSNVVASAGEDGTVRLWNVADGKQIKQVKVSGAAVTSIDFDHAGNFLVGSADDRARLFDVGGNPKTELPKLGDDVLEVAISHDHKDAFYGDWSGKIVSVPVGEPKSMTTLASNPPPVATRLVAVEKDAAKIRDELKAKQTELDNATKALSSANERLKQFDQQTQALASQSQKSVEAIAAAKKRLEEAKQKIGKMAVESRDAADRVIAARVATKDPLTDAAIIAAEAEQAAKLNELVAARKSISAFQKEIEAATQQAASIATQQKAHLEKRPPLVKERDAAAQTVATMKKQRDTVAARLAKEESLRQRLARDAS